MEKLQLALSSIAEQYRELSQRMEQIKSDCTMTVEEANELKAESLENDIVAVKKELTDLREKYALLRALFEAKTGEKIPEF